MISNKVFYFSELFHYSLVYKAQTNRKFNHESITYVAGGNTNPPHHYLTTHILKERNSYEPDYLPSRPRRCYYGHTFLCWPSIGRQR